MKKQTKNLSRSNAIEDVSKQSHGRNLKKKIEQMFSDLTMSDPCGDLTELQILNLRGWGWTLDSALSYQLILSGPGPHFEEQGTREFKTILSN